MPMPLANATLTPAQSHISDLHSDSVHCPITSAQTPPIICVQDKSFNILREPLQKLLDSLSEDIMCKHGVDAKLKLKIHDFASNMTSYNAKQQPNLDKTELLECAKFMRKVSKSLSGDNKKYQISTHLLSKHLYCEWVQKDVSDRRMKLLKKNDALTQPGNTTGQNVNIGSSLGIPSVHLSSITLNTGVTVSKSTECDDEGIIGKSKETSISGGISASANLSSLAKLKGSLNISHSCSGKGVNFASIEDYTDSLCSKLRYSSLGHHIRKKHSLKYYQNSSLNNLDKLNASLAFNMQTPFQFTCRAPHQDNVKLKKTQSTTISASLDANILPIAELSVGATVGYTHAQKDIYINIRNSMTQEVITNKDTFYINQVEKLTPYFSTALKDLLGDFDKNGFMDNYKRTLSSYIPADTLDNALTQLEGVINIYCYATRGSDAGDKHCAQLKHQIESKWGVEEKGRYGFLQCSEVMLALLSNRLSTVPQDSETFSALHDKIKSIDSSITSPALSYDKSKLEKYISFNKKLKVELNNNSFDMNFKVGGNMLNNNLMPSANLHVTIKNNTTQMPGRLRAGNYKDITFDFNTDLNLANIPDNILSAIATQTGIPEGVLTTTLAQNINTNVDFSLGGRIMIRYFRPAWQSSLSPHHKKYSHQFTRVFVNTAASTALNVSGLLPIGLNAGVSVSKSKVVNESLGDKTLSYLLLRYAYCKGTWDKGGEKTWASLMESNHKSLTKIMHDITSPGSQLHEEADLIINDFRNTASSEQVESLNASLGSIFSSLGNAEETNGSFNLGVKALQQLLDLQQQETGRILREGLLPQKFSKKKILTR